MSRKKKPSAPPPGAEPVEFDLPPLELVPKETILPGGPQEPLLPPACKTCRHWFAKSDDLGQCRESPPTLAHKITEFGPVGLPLLTPSDFSCGRHSPR